VTERLQKAKVLVARTYTSLKYDKEKPNNTNFDKIWDLVSIDTREWALRVIDELETVTADGCV